MFRAFFFRWKLKRTLKFYGHNRTLRSDLFAKAAYSQKPIVAGVPNSLSLSVTRKAHD